MEKLCEQRGFVFHPTGRGKWGGSPYYSFERAAHDGAEFFKIAYSPHTSAIKVESAIGTFTGKVDSPERFERLAEAMGIDLATVYDKEVAHANAEKKMEQKMALLNRVAGQLQMKYGFRYEKCVSLAQMGHWWSDLNHLSQLSNRQVDACTAQVVQMIENGEIY